MNQAVNTCGKIKDAEFYMELNNQMTGWIIRNILKSPEEKSSDGLNNKLARGECYEKKTSGILRWHLE